MSELTDEQAAQAAEMEGFYEKGKRSGLFLQLFDGSICQKSKEVPTEPGWEAEPIETMHPKTKAPVHTYVKRFDKLICRIVDVNKRRAEFKDGGKVTNWNFTLMAGSKKATLQTTWMDALLRKLLKVGPNIDFDQPIMLGAFKKMINGKDKQLISIRQGGTSRDSDDWVAVPFYWEKKRDENGDVILSSKAKAPDGSILPEVEHDEDEDTWDSKVQNKFLATHFVENTLPRIKEIAERLGIKANMTVEDDTPTHTGPAEPEIPVVTKRPENGEAEGLSDAMTPSQAKGLKKLGKQIKKDLDTLSQKWLECDFDDLSIHGAAYLKHRIEKRIAKAREEDPSAFPEPEEDTPIRAAQKSAKKQSSDEDEDDEDDWGTAAPPKKAKKADPDEDDEDDVSFGEHDDTKLRDKDGNEMF